RLTRLLLTVSTWRCFPPGDRGWTESPIASGKAVRYLTLAMPIFMACFSVNATLQNPTSSGYLVEIEAPWAIWRSGTPWRKASEKATVEGISSPIIRAVVLHPRSFSRKHRGWISICFRLATIALTVTTPKPCSTTTTPSQHVRWSTAKRPMKTCPWTRSPRTRDLKLMTFAKRLIGQYSLEPWVTLTVTTVCGKYTERATYRSTGRELSG